MIDIRRPIEKKYLILCEGIDVCYFLEAYFRSSELRRDKRFDEIQLISFDGIHELAPSLRVIPNMDGFKKVKRLLIIRDAETDVDAAEKMIRNALMKAGFEVPDHCHQWSVNGNPLVAYTLLPSCDDNPVPGALEDLCWRILKDENGVRNDVLSFVTELEKEHHCIGAHLHKSRLHTYFSVNKGLISMKVGNAARAGAFDWNSKNLLCLRNLIQGGFSSL